MTKCIWSYGNRFTHRDGQRQLERMFFFFCPDLFNGPNRHRKNAHVIETSHCHLAKRHFAFDILPVINMKFHHVWHIFLKQHPKHPAICNVCNVFTRQFLATSFPRSQGVFCPHFVKRHIHQSPGASSNYLSTGAGDVPSHMSHRRLYPAW